VVVVVVCSTNETHTKKRAIIKLIANAFQLCFRVRHSESSGKPRGIEIEWYISAPGLC